jgi:hypothetical protein
VSKTKAPELAPWENGDVQRIYEIFCDDQLEHKPPEEHWEGYCSRLAVQAVVVPYRERIAALERVAVALRDALQGITESMEVLPWQHRGPREDAYIKIGRAALSQAATLEKQKGTK